MLFSSSKCPLADLVAWCRALRHSLGAGLSPVRIFKQQAKSGPRSLRGVAADVTEKLEAGESLEDAFEPYRDRFPPLFLELVAVGEQTGRLEDTFQELEAYYESNLSVQRNFRAQMMYPAIQFIAAILIISGLIWIMGMLGSSGKAITTDPTGTGLTGTTGAILFMVIAFGSVGVVLLLMKKAANNVQWRGRMEAMLLRFPGWGPALLSFALQRFAVALRMCVEAGLSAEKTMRYSFRATSNAAFTSGEERAVEVVKRGRTMSEALRASGAPFTDEFREMVLMGEETGNIPEVMERVANQLREEAERRMRSAAQLTSWCIYGLVAIMIIIFIFKIASGYLGAIGAA
jgi:type II secretory pathway component PulF